ncbi:MAG: HK97 family phage prohead protease [Nitrosomonadaceae bacterium]
MSKERRFYSSDIEVRKMDDGSERIEGYAIVFDSDSRNLGGFIEQIDKRALDNADVSDVVALFNHDNNLVLGRTPGTLSLTIDERGLKYSIEPADTQTTRDLLTSIKRKDIRGSSFQFSVAADGDEWIEPEERGQLWGRRVNKIDKLWDVSPVTIPAYEATDSTIAKRSLGMLKDEKEKRETEAQELEEAKRKARINKINRDLELFAKAHKL